MAEAYNSMHTNAIDHRAKTGPLLIVNANPLATIEGIENLTGNGAGSG
jgi:hypothetical protein